MKNNKGISLITLVITIVVLIIISGITIYRGGVKNIDQTLNIGAYTEALNVSDAITSRAFLNRIDPEKYPYIGRALSGDDVIKVNNITYGKGWHQLTSGDTIKLGLENVVRTYVVNYSTGEVVSVLPIIVDDEEYYALDELRPVIGEDDEKVSPTQYDEIKKVNKPVLVNGMVPVKNVDGNWVVVNASDSEWYNYSGDVNCATVMLMDELEIEGYTNEQIRNTELFNLVGKKVTTSGSVFVWIPRYSTDIDGIIVFSKLTDDHNSEEANSAFGNLTGFWISQYEGGVVEQ